MDKNIVVTLLIFGIVGLIQALSSRSRRKIESSGDSSSDSLDSTVESGSLRELFEQLSGGGERVSSGDSLEGGAVSSSSFPLTGDSVSSGSQDFVGSDLVREFESRHGGGSGYSSFAADSQPLKSAGASSSECSEEVTGGVRPRDFNLRDAVLYSEIINRRRF